MDPDRWNQLQELFEEALARGDAADASLEQADLDPELRRELELLLEAHQGEKALGLERTLLTVGASALGSGSRIGPYVILSQLGAGGMGEVWLAERDEAGYMRRVALKRIRHGFESEELRRRFRIEHQALARLNHRSIARLLDGGVAEDGVPFLALEFVEGLPITRYCDQEGLSVDRRIELFVEVCQAVGYAHANLVVHRDLKPSNILVEADGSIRLLDFGIAKLLDPATGTESPPTRTQQRMATPEYASPEQMRGEPITTATDIYALGVLLYELLAGRRPFADDETPSAALERSLDEIAPPRPSDLIKNLVRGGLDHEALDQAARDRGTSPAGLARALRGDLDTIVLSALRKEPERRYPSVERLADDLRSHRLGLPIQARPDTLGYRVTKFVGRNRVGVGFLALFIVLLSGFAVVSLRQSALVASERDTARSERDRAQEISQFLLDLFARDPLSEKNTQRDDMTLREFLERSEGQVRRELAGRPILQGALLSLLGRFYGNLGRLDRAEELAREGLELRRSLAGDQRADITDSLTTLATVLQERGEYDDAEPLFREALALRRQLYGEEHLDVAESANNLGILLYFISSPELLDEAEDLLRRSLELRQRLPDADELDVAQSLNSLASLLYGSQRESDAERAEPLLREALEIRGRLLGEDHPSVAVTRNNLANLLHDAGRNDEAERLFREAIRAWSATLGPEHPRVAAGLYGLSEVLIDLGDLEAAEEALRRAMEIDRLTLPSDHPYIALGDRALGRILVLDERPQEAEPVLRHAWQILLTSNGEQSLDTAVARSELGACLVDLERYEEAAAHLEAAHDVLSSDPTTSPEVLARSRGHLAELARAGGTDR